MSKLPLAKSRTVASGTLQPEVLMCLKPRSLPPIPDETRSVAEQIYLPDHPLRRLGEDYADILCDQDFADLYSGTHILDAQTMRTAYESLILEVPGLRVSLKGQITVLSYQCASGI